MKKSCLIATTVVLLSILAPAYADPNAPQELLWTCGSANGDSIVNIGDAIYIYNYIFGGSAPSPVEAGNANGGCQVNMQDVIYLGNFVFHGGPGPFGCPTPSPCGYSVNTGNTVRIGSPPYTPYAGDDSVAIPIYISNSATVYGLTVGFHYTSDNIEITSINTSGSVVSPRFMTDTVQNKFLVGWADITVMSGCSAQSGGLLVTLNARITGGTTSQSIPLDSAFVGPSGDFIFVDINGSGTRPVFVKPHDLLVITTTADSGPGSLRKAVDSANALAGSDNISFTVSGTISLATALPALTDDGTIIAGSTAPGGAHSVIINGSGLGAGSGITIQCADNKIEGLTIINFPENGITVTGASSTKNTLTNNVIYGNGGLGIDLGDDGVTSNDVGDGDTGPNTLVNYPEIDSVVSRMNETYDVYGSAAALAKIELFVAHPARQSTKLADPSGYGQAYSYVGSDTCDGSGNFVFIVASTIEHFSVLTATATDAAGNTSEFSQNFTLRPAPLIVVAYSPVNIILTDPNSLRFGKDSLGNDITGIPDGHYFITPNDSVVIDHPIEGTYIVQFVTDSGTLPNSFYDAIIKIDGTQQLIIAADKLCPASGKADTTTYKVEEGYHYKNGDANRDNTLNIGDAVFVVNYIFKGGPAPDPYLAADANCDRVVNIGDAVYVINYIFKGGHSPCYFEP